MEARNRGEQWYADNDYKWMSADQWECFEMLCDLCRGAHHIGGKVTESGSNGIKINLTYGFDASTFDYSGLTRAVVLAHDRCIRFAILPANSKSVKLILHKRQGRTGDMGQIHPHLEVAIERERVVKYD